MNSLEEARKTINEVDAKMAELFSVRMRAAEVVARHKKEHGLKILDATREAEVIRRNSALVEDKILREYYVKFIENCMSLSRAYQERLLSGMKVAYSGTKGAFAHIATNALFPSAQKKACSDFASAYEAVALGECDVAVLPVENSSNGDVGQVTDLLFSGSLYVNSMLNLEVTQDLLGIPGAALADIKEVISHPQALGQCADYLSDKGFVQHEYANTALAAKKVAEMGDKSVAAIASAQAAELFGLCVLEKNINKSKNNTTRFAVLSRSDNTYPESENGVHTILMFTVRNEAGALAKSIDIIGKHGFNMRSLHSRPMKELLWEYYFYVELEGNIHTDNGAKMLEELKTTCDKLKTAGTFKEEVAV
ncbi:MAG: prephenate dehydratase domain-containing protein [Clostridia bacterium]|nr:prephenate dehydratase domain-containing protein [Clostridia bacterium]